MHAYTITGGSEQNRRKRFEELLDKLEIHQKAVVRLDKLPDKQSIGIEETIAFIRSLYLSPLYGSHSAGYISDAHLLTQEAQNALLKTLEEPPNHVSIILDTPFISRLLPTIRSRCFHIGATGNQQDFESLRDDIRQIISNFEGKSPGAVSAGIDRIGQNKEQALLLCEAYIALLHERLRQCVMQDSISKPTDGDVFKWAAILRKALSAQAHLSANVNHKLVLESLFF